MSTLGDKLVAVVQQRAPGVTRVQTLLESVEATAGGVYATLSQMVDKGRLVRVGPGVYAMPGSAHAPAASPSPPHPLPTSLATSSAALTPPARSAPEFGVIERGIPVPAPKRKGRPMADLAERMQPGDSVLLQTKHQAHSLCRVAKAMGIPLTSRCVEGGHRVWRTA